MHLFSSLKKVIIIIFSLLISTSIIAQSKQENFTVENYYKIKWGFANEFIDLWKKIIIPL